jgi:hypothetical protein
MGCVTSTAYAILINGEATKKFQSSRGLRQGCSLSPLLFILCDGRTQPFTKKIKQMEYLSGIKVSRLIKVLHLLFMDDILIMSKASVTEWVEINNILCVFCRASGLVINVQKYAFLHSEVHQETLTVLKELYLYSFKDLSEGLDTWGIF